MQGMISNGEHGQLTVGERHRLGPAVVRLKRWLIARPVLAFTALCRATWGNAPAGYAPISANSGPTIGFFVTHFRQVHGAPWRRRALTGAWRPRLHQHRV